MKRTQAFFFLFFLMGVSFTYAQSKKDIKKFHIKSLTVTVTEPGPDGHEQPRNESFEKFDNAANTIEQIEYTKTGAFKSRQTARYNKNNDKTEEVELDLKGNVIKKTVTAYNVNNDKSTETTYDGQGKVLEKTTYTYNAMGEKEIELTTDGNEKVKRKVLFKYDKNGLKTEKKTYNEKGELINTKKYSYQF